MVELSIVLPTYNERKNISLLIPLLENILETNKMNGEIIVVDDNSPDGTAQEAKNLNKKYKNIKLILRKKKEGIGTALREGYNQSKGNIILSMDADMSFDIIVMLDLIKKLKEGYDMIIGYKIGYKAQTAKKSIQGIISGLGNKFMSTISGVKIHDFTPNFRAMKKEVWQAINTREKTNVFLFEMILLAKHKGFKIGEVPVTFKDRVYGESKIRISKEIPKFLFKSISLSLRSRLNMVK
jgi:dolichol-phosphate mannosyltransferase